MADASMRDDYLIHEEGELIHSWGSGNFPVYRSLSTGLEVFLLLEPYDSIHF